MTIEIDGDSADLQDIQKVLEAVLELDPTLYPNELRKQVRTLSRDGLQKLKTAADTAINRQRSRQVAERVAALEPRVQAANRALEELNVEQIFALLATEHGINAWREAGANTPLTSIKGEWLTKARDKIMSTILSGLKGRNVHDELKRTLYTLKGNGGGVEALVSENLNDALSVASQYALQTFDLSHSKQRSAFKTNFKRLAVKNDKSNIRIVDVISRGGKTALEYVQALTRSKSAGTSQYEDKPVIVRILLPPGESTKPDWWDTAGRWLEWRNSYLWLCRSRELPSIHGNLIRTLDDPDSLVPAQWWSASPDLPPHSVRDLHLGMRDPALRAPPVYLYIPCEFLAAQQLGRQVAAEFDKLWKLPACEGKLPHIFDSGAEATVEP